MPPPPQWGIGFHLGPFGCAMATLLNVGFFDQIHNLRYHWTQKNPNWSFIWMNSMRNLPLLLTLFHLFKLNSKFIRKIAWPLWKKAIYLLRGEEGGNAYGINLKSGWNLGLKTIDRMVREDSNQKLFNFFDRIFYQRNKEKNFVNFFTEFFQHLTLIFSLAKLWHDNIFATFCSTY